jgi:imidazolonepropionase-like amidohydrolase
LAPEVAVHRDTLVAARRRLHELGAAMVVGSDAGITPAKPHDVLPYSFGDLTECGMTPVESLRTLTSAAARACGLAGRKGRLTAGSDADVIALAGDPISDPQPCFSVTAVWRCGSRLL